MSQPTLSLELRPGLGRKVVIRRQRIVGTIHRVRAAARDGYWWLDILPDTYCLPDDIIPNVYSGGVDYVEVDGALTPVSPPAEPPLGNVA